MAYRDVVLADSPVDYYEMSTSTGTDSGSGNRTLTLSGGITTGAVGRIGNGWTFDGVNDSASMGTWPSLTSAFTFEAWVKPNLGGVNDTPTIIRRDGTDIMLLRVRGSAIPVNPGQAEVYADGLTLVSGSSYRVDDGNWHHIVYTQSGNTARLYVDGVERASGTTSQSSFNMGTGAGYIGSANGTTEFYKGTMDEVAVYNTALSATRVLAHYNAATVNAGYTAQVMTASAEMPDAVALGNVQTLAVTDDTYIMSQNAGSNYSTQLSVSLAEFNENRAFFKTAAKVGDEAETSRTLYIYRGSSTNGTISVYRVEADWSESTLTYNNRPPVSLIRTVAVSGTGYIPVNVSGADIGYGVALSINSADSTFVSSESATNKPYATITTAPVASASHTAAVMTAAATMPNATVATSGNAHYGAQAMAATAAMPNAVASTEQFIDIDLDVEPMDAYATWPTATGFTLNATIVAEPFAAGADTADAPVSVERGPVVKSGVMSATALWKQPSAVNDMPIVASETDDKYFQRVMAVPPSIWFRLNGTGSTEPNRMAPTSLNKGYYEGGVQRGQFNAPDGRHSVYFDGTGRIRQEEGGDSMGGSETVQGNSALEFSFRTTKADTFLMVVADNRVNSSIVGAKEIYLDKGRIKVRHYPSLDGSAPYKEFTAFRNLADGQWHNVVIRNVDNTFAESNVDGIEIYVDGKFEIRRQSDSWLIAGFPDFIGSRPERMNPGSSSTYVLPALPSSLNFVGDMTEIVSFNTPLSEYEITRHYYAFMGWNPIEATSMDAFAFTPADSRGRGNQKRALYLWWDEFIDSYFVGGTGVGPNAPVDPRHNTMNFDPVLAGHGNHGIYDLEDYKVFSRGVTRDTLGFEYRDEVTDQPSLINLDVDVDIDDYDVIMFGDWPDEGWEDDRLSIYVPDYKNQKERLLNQLWAANNKGIGLMVTHPRLAVDLGLIDRVEYVPTLKEYKSNGGQGNAAGLYDYGSAVKFPWNITADAQLGDGDAGADSTGEPMNTDPAYLAYKAFFYEDMNFNNKFRVRAMVDGLTNIPSYMIKDAIYRVDYDIWGDDLAALDLEDRLNGLVIGDEFIFHGTNVGNLDYYDGLDTGFRVGRPFGYYAVPPGHVKGGTVVTTFGATHWKNQQVVTNPYADYATTIAYGPGDAVGGKAVQGRIFVSFTEQANRFELVTKADVLPGSKWDDGTATWPHTYTPDTEAQRNWEWSGTRTTASNSAVKGEMVFINVQMPDGSYSTIKSGSGSSGGGRLVSANYSNLFATAILPRWDMTRRGMWWVGRGEKAVEGDVRVAAEPMTATAAIAEPAVVAQRDAAYVAEPMRALAQMPRVAESEVGDVEIVTLPWTAEATWTGFSKVISAQPMLAEAEFVENFDMVHASGEQVVLTLHGVDATLYLKEEN